MLLSLRSSLLSSMSPDICKDSGICQGFNDFLKQYQFDSPTEKDECGWTPMHYATIEGNVSVMQDLLERGADIHSATTENDTDFFCIPESAPIAWAARWGGRETVEFLLDSGANSTSRAKHLGFHQLFWLHGLITLRLWTRSWTARRNFMSATASMHRLSMAPS